MELLPHDYGLALLYGAVGLVCSVGYFEEMDLLEPYLGLINISSVYKVLNTKK